MKFFIKLLNIFFLIFIIFGCANNKEKSVRDEAILLISTNYPINGSRNLEYSQVDSTDASLNGYYIHRLYINNGDSIKLELFHLNYNRTSVNKIESELISSSLYKRLLNGSKVFTDSLNDDIKRISLMHTYLPDLERKEMLRVADSIRIADSIN